MGGEGKNVQYLKVKSYLLERSHMFLSFSTRKAVKSACLFGGFCGVLRDFCCLSRHKKPTTDKMLTLCRDQTLLWAEDTSVSGRGDEGSLEPALLQLPPAISNLLPSHRGSMEEGMVSENSEKQAKILCNQGCQEMEWHCSNCHSPVKHNDGRISKTECKLRLFRTKIFFC